MCVYRLKAYSAFLPFTARHYSADIALIVTAYNIQSCRLCSLHAFYIKAHYVVFSRFKYIACRLIAYIQVKVCTAEHCLKRIRFRYAVAVCQTEHYRIPVRNRHCRPGYIAAFGYAVLINQVLHRLCCERHSGVRHDLAA